MAYFMVSLDEPERNRSFAESEGADFVLLSDPDKKSADRFGVLALGGLYARRWTFYIDADGIIRRIDKQVTPATHGEDVVRALGELDFPRRRDTKSQTRP